MTYCNIVTVKTGQSITGDDLWLLTHACGKVERRVRKKRGKRHETKAPVRVKCENNGFVRYEMDVK